MYITIGFVIAVAAIAALAYGAHRGGAPGVATPPLISQSLLRTLPRKSASNADTSHVSKSLVPPTNTWLSGMVLQATPEAVYPLPLSFLAKNDGFEMGVPTIQAKATEIDGEHVPGITVQTGATGFQLTRYDKLSATLTYRRGTHPLGELTLSEGSPFAFYTAATDTTLRLTGINPADIIQQGAHYVHYHANGHTYAVYGAQASITVTGANVTISLHKGDLVSFYGLPGTTDFLKPYAGNALRAITVSHTRTGNGVRTTFAVKTSNNRPTVFAAPPYAQSSGRAIGHYQSIYGPMTVRTGLRFTTSVPYIKPSGSLDLSRLTTGQRAFLAKQLPIDIDSTKIDQQDSYYAGKQLTRAANLLDIAEQLHQTASINRLKAILAHAFAQRLRPDYFYYDPTLKGVVVAQTAFGSQNFNDHHFHYGYWLYAASILGKYDTGFTHTYKAWINLLAADIADYRPDDSFPQTRYYDPYAAHSWADGLAPFADGNDQESSSEAVHAWNGVALWGQATGDTALTATAEWMLANENYTAATTWRTVDTTDPALQAYTSPVVGIAFGGKRTYSTWFSDNPAAKLAIQLIPMDPSMATSFMHDTHSDQAIAASIQNDDFNVPLGDYILMYYALISPHQADQLLAKQTVIDDGDSATYLHAFVFSQLNRVTGS